MTQKRLAEFASNGASPKRLCRIPRRTIENSNFAACPLCQTCLPMHVLISHAGICDGTKMRRWSNETNRDRGMSTRVEPLQLTSTNTKKHYEPTPLSEVPWDKNKDLAKTIVSPWWKRPTLRNDIITIDNSIAASSEPIPGLHLYPEFITIEEEAIILAELDGSANREAFLPWKASHFNGRHRGKRWGVHCNLRDRRVGAPENPMPPFFCKIILPKLQRVIAMKGCTPNEANAIDYHRKEGDYLQDHVDDRQLSKEPIANLSIGGDCYMTFINQKKKFGTIEEPLRVLLPRRTLQVLTGRARYDYSHGIRNEDFLDDRRVSVTMRESPLTK